IHNMRENIRHQGLLYQGEFELLSKIGPHFDVLVNFLAELFVPAIAEAYKIPNIKLFTFPMVRSERYAPPTGLPFIAENGCLNPSTGRRRASPRGIFSGSTRRSIGCGASGISHRSPTSSKTTRASIT